MAAIACEVLISVYLFEALEICPKIVTPMMATMIQKRGPRKSFCARVCGVAFTFFFAALFSLDFLNLSNGDLVWGAWEDMELLMSTCAWQAHQ